MSDGNSMGFQLVRFGVLVVTDCAMLPALNVMKSNRRHFELFIGVFQLGVAFGFNLCQALNVAQLLQIPRLQWHFISDVLSIAYFLHLCVHLMGFRTEDHNIVLRYVAFAGAWLAKARDGWDNISSEMVLVGSYMAGVAYRRLIHGKDKEMAPLNKKKAFMAVAFGVGVLVVSGLPMLGAALDSSLEQHWYMTSGIHLGLMHVLGGAGFFYAWQSVPCLDSKKHDDLMPRYSSYL